MKPGRAHYLFAQHWPLRLWMFAPALGSGFAVVWVCFPEPAAVSQWPNLREAAPAVILATLLGYFSSLLLGWFVLGPIYYDRAIKNGAPFQVGDRVRILRGPYRDHVSHVYALWQGQSVRVRLGPAEERKLRDIFAPTEVLREPPEAARALKSLPRGQDVRGVIQRHD